MRYVRRLKESMNFELKFLSIFDKIYNWIYFNIYKKKEIYYLF